MCVSIQTSASRASLTMLRRHFAAVAQRYSPLSITLAAARLHSLAAAPSRSWPAARCMQQTTPLLPCSLPLSRPFASLSLSPREKSVLKLLQSIRHPSAGPSGDDIVFSGHVRSVAEKDGVVSLVLPLDDAYRTLKRQVTETLEGPAKPEWLKGVRVVMEAAKGAGGSSAAGEAAGTRTAGKVNGLSNVRHIIAVSSCKGGVGKSTVSVNLAYALAQLQVRDSASGARDARVGILDADIYGPSLPTMVSPRDTTLRYNDARQIEPPVYQGVKTMSYGYVTSSQAKAAQQAEKGAGSDLTSTGAFIRGPLASAAVKQMASETAWGSLDYLVVDFPPGTGDIQLTLTQLLRLSGAVVVTTPGKLSYVDVAKGLSLFTKTHVPVLGLVENMSYFLCATCDTKHRIFGEHGAEYMQRMQREFGKVDVLEVPMWKEMAKASDSGDPFMLGHDESGAPVRALYAQLASTIQQQLDGGDAVTTGPSAAATASAIPQLTFDPKTARVTLHEPATPAAAASSSPSSSSVASAAPRSLSLSAHKLRLACRCAGCIDETTGVPKLNPARVPADVKPLGMQPRGNYAVAVHWSDGHASSLYPFDQIRKLAQEEGAV